MDPQTQQNTQMGGLPNGVVAKSQELPQDEDLRVRLEHQHEESMQAVSYHRNELERHERLVRTARAGLTELNSASPVEEGVAWDGDSPEVDPSSLPGSSARY